MATQEDPNQPAKSNPKKIDDDAPKEFTKTDSGLKYRVLRKSSGVKATKGCKVTVHYRGWLPDKADPDKGNEFDSSYANGEPITFPLGGVIAGWTEGMQLVGKGGMVELEVPSQLGYGERGFPGAIPPNATLRFVVELLDVIPPPEPVKLGAVDADAATEFTTTSTGLKYRIRRKGSGKNAGPADEVTVHYKGWLPDKENPDTGEVFDSSYDRGETISFPLNRVIPGWTEGMQLVKEGGMIELEVPSELGYGAGGQGSIPPNATLRFIVELKKVEDRGF